MSANSSHVIVVVEREYGAEIKFRVSGKVESDDHPDSTLDDRQELEVNCRPFKRNDSLHSYVSFTCPFRLSQYLSDRQDGDNAN